ncbi:PD-(D/E)XK nuclease family protein [Ruicaihuangia caeni]|uniref:DNA 3'-5' helicase n=1 Tax=Ruicaihuangia caeni TaxID=3042517 RepID=A0AAW6TE32_9MICO|nr:ATP-dependent DNA helicase [Klugiella sp. YN-L-19]MDI2099675.1 ATP-dependent DNA helicase [Klugiella sp. YN-L-19]
MAVSGFIGPGSETGAPGEGLGDPADRYAGSAGGQAPSALHTTRLDAAELDKTQLDETQTAVLRLDPGVPALVLGAPGAGKTTTAIELIAQRVADGTCSPDEVVMLTASRTGATRLRSQVARRIGRATNGPLVRTVNSLAFEVLSYASAMRGAPPPSLLTGGEQDQLLRELLAGHAEDGGGPEWPEHLGPEVRALRGFRTELRELLMRATEHDIDFSELRRLGRLHGVQEWEASAAVAEEQLLLAGQLREGSLDVAQLAVYAEAAIGRGEMPESVARLRLVVVDDVQEATESFLRVLTALHRAGKTLVGFGDPDVATSAFRGASGDAVALFATRLGITPSETLTLRYSHRQPAALRAFTAAVTDRIGVAATAASRRRLLPGAADAESVADTHGASAERSAEGAEAVADRPPTVERIQARSAARELAAIARRLRERHLIDGVPLRELAVIVRSGAQLAAIVRALALAEVPARTSLAAKPVRDDLAAYHLMSIVDLGIERRALDADIAAELLLGPFGRLDRLGLRRLRLALRAEEFRTGGTRSADELLVDALGAPGGLATIDHQVGRAAASFGATLARLRAMHAEGATVEELLWEVWERSRLADDWRRQALGGGPSATEANRNLDGVLAVFTAARRFVERRPGYGAAEFLAEMLDAEVPEDTLAPQQADDAVLVTTPNGAAGLEFDMVVVAGLQENVWPDLRLRGSLLRPDALVRAAAAPQAGVPMGDVVRPADGADILDERRQVLHDELRLFALAVSRARRRVVLTCVDNDDTQGSIFCSLAPAGTPVTDDSGLGEPPLSLRGMTGRLRRVLTSSRSSGRDLDEAASALAVLAAEAVPGADPDDWHGVVAPSSEAALFADRDHVPVSPSRLELIERSPLDWFVQEVAGSEPSNAMAIGTVLHSVMEHAASADPQELMQALDENWKDLAFESEWLAAHEYRRAQRLIVGLAEYLSDCDQSGRTVIAREGRFTVDVGRARIRGSIDRVERDADGAVTIIDLKTGAPITSQREIDDHGQLWAYQLAYASGCFDEILPAPHRSGGAKLVFIREGKGGKAYREAVQGEPASEQLDAFRRRVLAAVEAMAAAEFSGSTVVDRFGRGDLASMRLHRVKAVSSD